MVNVTIQNVVKSFGHVRTIRDVSVTVPDGSFTVLVGPSGCGKSTLLRMIGGLEEIDSGTISIDGRVINEMESKDRDIGMVFQNYALYPHMTVEKNMDFLLWLAKMPKAEIRTRVAEAARILDLTPYLDRYPRQLSGGQRQRVAMGRAIVRQSKVYLFDEPLSNLDAKLRVQVGAPLELYDRPGNTFVAGFIGSPAMNLLSPVADGEGKLVLEGGAHLMVNRSLEAGLKVTLGIRPEHVTLDASGAGIPVVVETVEPTGANTMLLTRLGTLDVTAELRSPLSPDRGSTLTLDFRPEFLHFFDAETGLRIE